MFSVFGAVGDALKLAYRNMFRVAVAYLAFGVLAGVITALSGAVGGALSSPTGSGAGGLIVFVGSLLANILMFCSTLAAVAIVTSDALQARVSLREAITLGIRKSPAGFVVALVVMVAVGLVAAIPYIVFMGTLMGGGSIVVATLVFLAFLPVVLWVSAVFVPMFPLMLAEDAGVDAIRRSAAMTKGYRWAIAGGSLLLGLVAGLIGAVVGGGAMAIIGSSIAHDPGAANLSFLLTGLIFMIAGMFMAAIGVSYQAAVYARLSGGNEG